MAKPSRSKPNSDDLELAARLIAALYVVTKGRRTFRRISEVAERAGIAGADVEGAVAVAERAGLVVARLDEPFIMLTEKGLAAARAK